jgi:hypothetical protein
MDDDHINVREAMDAREVKFMKVVVERMEALEKKLQHEI